MPLFGKSRKERIKAKIKELFPDIHNDYLSEILEHYNLEKDARQDSSIVARISEKLLESMNFFPRNNQSKFVDKFPATLPSATAVEALNKQLLFVFEMFPNILPATARDYCWRYNESIPYAVEKMISIGSALSSRPSVQQFVQERDLFRDPIYINQVKRLLLNEFPFHWESTVCAIMAESNNYYPECHKKLTDIKTSTIWSSFLPFTKRSWIEFQLDHASLIREVEEMERARLDEIAEGDQDIASLLNQNEYAEEDQLIECKCCFGDFPFEELGQCTEGHLFCKTCLCQSVKIGLFNSGNLRGKKLKCMSSESDCLAEIELAQLERLVPDDLFLQYQGFLLESAVKGSLDLIFCPYCKYAEEKSPVFFLRKHIPNLIRVVKEYGTPVFRLLALAAIFYIILYSALTATLFFLFNHFIILKGISKEAFLSYIRKNVSVPTWAKPIPTVAFNCKNPKCLKVTCCECSEDWVSPHKCFEKQVDSLRLYVENAKSNALIRVCPSCSIRFSKIDGCNKMTCPNCKYEMCYVCRMDIGSQRYNHFCQHFRIIPGSDCTECKKCDLYQKERDDEAVAKAAAIAEKEWKQKNPASAAKVL